jgi:hypothetical protein
MGAPRLGAPAARAAAVSDGVRHAHRGGHHHKHECIHDSIAEFQKRINFKDVARAETEYGGPVAHSLDALHGGPATTVVDAHGRALQSSFSTIRITLDTSRLDFNA